MDAEAMSPPIRIAMWSGPRNISTAMMRAFGNRRDCAVTDEPFYAAYLAATGLDHPMREDVIASQPTDWRTVAAALTGLVPGGKAIWYQKHMTHTCSPASAATGSIDASTPSSSARPWPCSPLMRRSATTESVREHRRRAGLSDLGAGTALW